MQKGARIFAPGDTIPHAVLSVYDLDGDVWDRWSNDPADTMRGSWRMRDLSGVLTGKLRLETARCDHKPARSRCRGDVGESVDVAAYAQQGGCIGGDGQ
jgi:hypothetical protein